MDWDLSETGLKCTQHLCVATCWQVLAYHFPVATESESREHKYGETTANNPLNGRRQGDKKFFIQTGTPGLLGIVVWLQVQFDTMDDKYKSAIPSSAN